MCVGHCFAPPTSTLTHSLKLVLPSADTCTTLLLPPHRRPTRDTQFERTLIVAEDDAYVSYLEGCTAPAYDSNQLHAAVVELSAGANAEIKYSTVQNW